MHENLRACACELVRVSASVNGNVSECLCVGVCECGYEWWGHVRVSSF